MILMALMKMVVRIDLMAKNREAVTTAIDYDINPIVDKSLEQYPKSS